MSTDRELLGAAIKLLAALEEEAAAILAIDNAEANFSNAGPERRRAGRAMVAASIAMKNMREVVAVRRAAAALAAQDGEQ